jgi:hypothetical protein
VRVELYNEPTGEQVLRLVLSVTNLLTLLAKAYTHGSKRTLGAPGTPPGLIVRVTVEGDSEHYNLPDGRVVLPGELHPVTAHLVAALREALAQFYANEQAAGDPTDPRDRPLDDQ